MLFITAAAAGRVFLLRHGEVGDDRAPGLELDDLPDPVYDSVGSVDGLIGDEAPPDVVDGDSGAGFGLDKDEVEFGGVGDAGGGQEAGGQVDSGGGLKEENTTKPV